MDATDGEEPLKMRKARDVDEAEFARRGARAARASGVRPESEFQKFLPLGILGVPSEASKGGLGKKRAAKGPFQLLQQVAAFRDRGPIAYGRGQPQRCSAAARLHTVFRGRVSV